LKALGRGEMGARAAPLVDTSRGGCFSAEMATLARAARLFHTGLPRDGITPAFERLLRDSPPSGILLFRRDFVRLDRLEPLVRRLRSLAAPAPLLVSVDEEGGFVSQLAPDVPVAPSARVLGRAASARQVEALGEYTGRVLHAAGVDIDWAPVFDVDAETTNPVIGPRAFSPDPAVVGRLGVAFARGLMAGGVLSCAKHFPGHGETRADSHLVLPRSDTPRERLEARDFPPFHAAVADRVPLVMVSHVHFAAFDAEPVPATLSPVVSRDLLRQAFGFQGCAVTDAMEMKAVSGAYGAGPAARRALEAGCDVLLYGAWTPETEEALRTVAAALEEPAFAARVTQAERRLERLFDQRAAVAGHVGDAPAPQEPPLDLTTLCSRALQLEGDAAAVRGASRARWLVVEPEWSAGPTLASLLAERGWQAEGASWESAAGVVDRHDHVLVAHARRVAPTPEEAALLARAAGRPVSVLVAFGQDAFLRDHPRARLRVSAGDPGEPMRRAVAGRVTGPTV